MMEWLAGIWHSIYGWTIGPDSNEVFEFIDRARSALELVGGAVVAAYLWFRLRPKRAAEKSETERKKAGRGEGLAYEAIEPERDTVFAKLPGVAGDSTKHVTRPEVAEAVGEKPEGLLVWGPGGCGKTREAAEYALSRAAEMPRSKWCFVIGGEAKLESPQGAPGEKLEGAVVIFDDLQKHWERHQSEVEKGVAVGLHPGEIICEIVDYFCREAEDGCVATATVRSEDGETWKAMCGDPCWKKALERFGPHVWLGPVDETDVEREYLRNACEARGVTWSDEAVFEALVAANDGSFLTADEYLDELSGDGDHELTMEEAEGLAEACRVGWRKRVLEKLPAMQQEAVELCSILSACGLPMERELVLALDCERKCAGLLGKGLYGLRRRPAFGRALNALAKGTFPESDGVFRPHGSRLNDEGREELRREAAEVGGALIGMVRAHRGNAARQEELSVWLDRIGRELVVRGDVAAATRAYETALEIDAGLVGDDPSWQRSLSVSHNRIGDVRRAQGDLPGALTAYEASLEIRERLAAQDPGNAGLQRDLSVSHEKIGDVRWAQGDLPGALTAYEARHKIAERLAAQDPGNAEWQRDLSVSHERIGTVRRAQGDLPGALEAYKALLEIVERLAAQDPGNAEWQRDLAVSHEKIGDVRAAQGDLPGALEAYEASLEIAERLAAQDPGNAEWQRDLSVSHNKIGDVRRAQGDLPGALTAYEAALEMRERLAAQDPGNAQWQRDLSVSQYKLAQVANEAGDEEREKGHLLKCREILQGMKEKGMHLDAQDVAVLEGMEGMEEGGGEEE